MSDPSPRPLVEAFFDPATSTVSYVAHDPASRRAAIIDPVLDYDPKAGRTSTRSAEKIVAFVRSRDLSVDWLLETHVHADHLSAVHWLKQTLGGRIAIGREVATVQRTFASLFGLDGFPSDGSQFDHLFGPDEVFQIGGITATALHTPGHTPACYTYLIGDAAFLGDTLFMPDLGTARCDFPGGDPATLYRSISRILALPPETRLFLCHDYPEGRDAIWETTVAAQRRDNIHVRDGVTEADYVAMRTARDRTLQMPVLILPAVQVNMRAGELPPPAANGIRYLKIPLNAL